MDLWQRHAQRLRRQAELEHFNQWCLDHPWRARTLAWGLAILLFELSEFLRIALDAFGNWLAR